MADIFQTTFSEEISWSLFLRVQLYASFSLNELSMTLTGHTIERLSTKYTCPSNTTHSTKVLEKLQFGEKFPLTHSAGVVLDIFKMGTWNHMGCTGNMYMKDINIFCIPTKQICIKMKIFILMWPLFGAKRHIYIYIVLLTHKGVLTDSWVIHVSVN